jgi:CAAX prenyl protease-like protein
MDKGMMEILVDRPRKQAALAIGATWLLFCLAFVAEVDPTEPPDLAEFMLGGLLGAVLVVVGFYAASRCRPMPARGNAQRARLVLLSLCAGIAAGAVSLAVILGLASQDPSAARVFGGASEPIWRPLGRPLARAFGAAVVEEVAVRLFGMSVIAWLAARFAKRPADVFLIALSASALLFGLAHVSDFSLAGLTLVLLNVLAGVLLGWIFWRWGLAYAVLCHFAAGMIIQSLGPRLIA